MLELLIYVLFQINQLNNYFPLHQFLYASDILITRIA